MGIKELFLKTYSFAHKVSRYRFFQKEYSHRRKVLQKYGIPFKKLTKEQKAEIKKLWGRTDYRTHELIYSITGDFDPRYCSCLVFGTEFEFALNDDQYKCAWSDKNYFDLLFPNVRFPYTVARNVAGVFYDYEYRRIDEEEVLAIASKYNKLVFKPSLDSGQSTGIELVSSVEELKAAMKSRKRDYLIQEVMDQYEPLKALNPSSVNIVRLNSLFWEGKPYYVSATLRVGAPGAFSDNSRAKGKRIVGIEDDGRLKERAYCIDCGYSTTTESHTGIPFASVQIPNFEKVKKIAAEVHSKMPFAKFVGFDIAFDPDGEPVVMEYNINAPGVFYYQLANGPLLGDFTESMIKTILKHE